MNTKLLIASTIFLTSGVAIAKSVNLDTNITWNSSVVEQALNNAGLLGTNNALNDVRVTHERILSVLLKKKTFSPRFATQTCLDQCNRSDFLKEGRGRSGRKCPEICTDFTNELITVNNQFTRDGTMPIGDTGLMVKQKDGLIRLYTDDKKFYILTEDDYWCAEVPSQKHSNICKLYEYECTYIIFESSNNKPIGKLFFTGEGENEFCTIPEYNDYYFLGSANMSYTDVSFGYRTGKLQDDKEELLRPFRQAEKNAKEYRTAFITIDNHFRVSDNEISTYLLNEQEVKAKLRTLDRINKAIKDYARLNLTEEEYLANPNILNEFSGEDSFFLTEAYYINNEHESILPVLKNSRTCINDIKAMNGKTVDWRDRDTDNENQAYDMARDDIANSQCDPNKIRCSGDCNKLPFTDDTVTCTIGDVTIKYIFGDICD